MSQGRAIDPTLKHSPALLVRYQALSSTGFYNSPITLARNSPAIDAIMAILKKLRDRSDCFWVERSGKFLVFTANPTLLLSPTSTPLTIGRFLLTSAIGGLVNYG